MTKDPSDDALSWAIIRCFKWIFIGLFLLILFFAIASSLLPQLAFLLLFGWFGYLSDVLPRVAFNREIALDALIALLLGTGGLHLLLRWWARGKAQMAVWRLRWTLQIVAMALLLFATSVAAVGIVHQTGWLLSADKLTYNAGMSIQTKQLSNMKQLGLALKIYAEDHNGKFPTHLEELIPEILHDRQIFFTHAGRDEPPELVLYFSGLSVTDSPDRLLLASPRPFSDGRRAIIRVDISGEVIKEADYQELLRKQNAPR